MTDRLKRLRREFDSAPDNTYGELYQYMGESAVALHRVVIDRLDLGWLIEQMEARDDD